MEVGLRQFTGIFTALTFFQFCKGKFAVTVFINNGFISFRIVRYFGGTADNLFTDFFKFFLCIFTVFFTCRLFKHSAVSFNYLRFKTAVLNNIVLAVDRTDVNGTDN